MKTGILKRVSLFGLASLSLFTLSPSLAKAEKICTTHKNYYMYLLIDEVPGFVNRVYQAELASNEAKEYYNSAYFPLIPENAEFPKNNEAIISGRICMSKDGISDGNGNQCIKGLTWTVEEYYQKKIEATPNLKSVSFKDDKGVSRECKVYDKTVDNENGNKVIEHYYTGAHWFKCDDAQCKNATSGGSGADTSNLSLETLAKGSYLPLQTEITFNPASSSRTIITRRITTKGEKDTETGQVIPGNYQDYLTYDENGNPKVDESGNLIINSSSTKLKPFDLQWNANESVKTSLLAPAVYYVEYQICEDAYNADIEYFVKESDGTLTPAKEYDEEIVNYSKSELDDGYTEPVNTPKLSGCTADKAKVEVKIEGKDFYDKVIYTCKANQEIDNNNKTGDALIYLAWIIGLGAIGYSVYYFKKLKKEEI